MTQTLSFDYSHTNGEYIAPYMDGTLYRARAIHDEHAESPREWDNTCAMVCEHRHYNLGDYKDGSSQAIAAVRASRFYRDTWEDSESGTFRHNGATYDTLDLSYAPDLWQAVQMCEDIISTPLYLFDHSGLSISTGAFSCPWDSGQVGFAFVSKAHLKECQGKTRWTPALKQWARKMIECEVETYDSYLRGEVYGYIAERATEWDESGEPIEWDEIDSCWGYYGEPDSDESGICEQALAAIQYDARTYGDTLRQRRADAIDAIRAIVPDRLAASPASAAILQDRIAREARNARLAGVALRKLESMG